jgi:hypothetical protein
MKKIWKSQKPIDVDAHFRYRCSDPKCGFDHWISLKESQTKNFKIVCDCGAIFKPKRVLRLKIAYAKPKKKQIKDSLKEDTKPATIATKIVEKRKLSIDLAVKCSKILIQYGFTKQEAENLLEKAFEQEQADDPVQLVKIALQKVGEL